MSDSKIPDFLASIDEAEKRYLFQELRKLYPIHELEHVFGAQAEVILEAIHRAPELTRRMLRGVIADAAFAQYVVPALAASGWSDVTPPGNHSFDHMLDDGKGAISVQVKLQRSEAGSPVITTGTKYGLAEGMYMVEPQRTRGGTVRGGKNGNAATVVIEAKKTRPYRYGEFDVLAVSLRPSSNDWRDFRYTVGNWLLPGRGENEIATYQPVATSPNADWTDDFAQVAEWFRSTQKKTISNVKIGSLL